MIARLPVIMYTMYTTVTNANISPTMKGPEMNVFISDLIQSSTDLVEKKLHQIWSI